MGCAPFFAPNSGGFVCHATGVVIAAAFSLLTSCSDTKHKGRDEYCIIAAFSSNGHN